MQDFLKEISSASKKFNAHQRLETDCRIKKTFAMQIGSLSNPFLEMASTFLSGFRGDPGGILSVFRREFFTRVVLPNKLGC